MRNFQVSGRKYGSDLQFFFLLWDPILHPPLPPYSLSLGLTGGLGEGIGGCVEDPMSLQHQLIPGPEP